jgi:hypothetical protein
MQSIWDDFNSPLNKVEREWVRRFITIFFSLILVPFCIIYGIIGGALSGVKEAFGEFLEHFWLDCWYGNKDKL